MDLPVRSMSHEDSVEPATVQWLAFLLGRAASLRSRGSPSTRETSKSNANHALALRMRAVQRLWSATEHRAEDQSRPTGDPLREATQHVPLDTLVQSLHALIVDAMRRSEQRDAVSPAEPAPPRNRNIPRGHHTDTERSPVPISEIKIGVQLALGGLMDAAVRDSTAWRSLLVANTVAAPSFETCATRTKARLFNSLGITCSTQLDRLVFALQEVRDPRRITAPASDSV